MQAHPSRSPAVSQFYSTAVSCVEHESVVAHVLLRDSSESANHPVPWLANVSALRCGAETGFVQRVTVVNTHKVFTAFDHSLCSA